MYKNFQVLVKEVKKQGTLKLAVAAAQDKSVLQAVYLAMQHNFLEPILIGEELKIKSILHKLGVQEKIAIINQPDAAKASKIAVEIVEKGQAQALMKGLVNTAIFLQALLQKDFLRKKTSLSHLAAFAIPGQQKILFLADAAFNTYPTLKQKKLILFNAISALHKLC